MEKEAKLSPVERLLLIHYWRASLLLIAAIAVMGKTSPLWRIILREIIPAKQPQIQYHIDRHSKPQGPAIHPPHTQRARPHPHS